MSGAVDHRWMVAAPPRVRSPARAVLRHLVLARLRADWDPSACLDLELPSGAVVRLGPEDARAHARVHVHDDNVFARLLLRGEVGAGEAYVAGEWSSDDLVAAAAAFLRGTRALGIESPLTKLARLPDLWRHRRSENSLAGSRRNIRAHYDLGNAFYELFLDPETWSYSCAYWPDGITTLADAQHAKLERLCAWLALTPADHLLELGCGWGGMAIHAARTRGCRVTAITLSREQHARARARVAAAGLGDRVDIQLRDYRTLSPRRDRDAFTAIVSIEMLEAVGHEYLPHYFETCARLLPAAGRIALQTITMPDARYESYRRSVDWMQLYVFPGSLIPSLAAIRRATQHLPLALARCDDIGPSYAPTLAAWRSRFLAALPRVHALGFDDAFVRTWLLYLAFSEAAFRERTLGDHQLLFVKR